MLYRIIIYRGPYLFVTHNFCLFGDVNNMYTMIRITATVAADAPAYDASLMLVVYSMVIQH